MPLDGSAAPDMSALDLLDRATRLIDQPDKWCKQQLRSFDGRRCLIGALMAVDAIGVLGEPVMAAVRDVTGKDYLRLEMFNDHPLTTHALVMRVMARARERLVRPAPPAPPRSWLRRLLGRLPAWA